MPHLPDPGGGSAEAPDQAVHGARRAGGSVGGWLRWTSTTSSSATGTSPRSTGCRSPSTRGRCSPCSGPNGAGKTIDRRRRGRACAPRPSGTVRVLGLDPRREHAALMPQPRGDAPGRWGVRRRPTRSRCSAWSPRSTPTPTIPSPCSSGSASPTGPRPSGAPSRAASSSGCRSPSPSSGGPRSCSSTSRRPASTRPAGCWSASSIADLRTAGARRGRHHPRPGGGREGRRPGGDHRPGPGGRQRHARRADAHLGRGRDPLRRARRASTPPCSARPWWPAVDEVAPGEYVVAAEPTPANINALTSWLAAHDVPLADLRAGRQSLEDVFLRMTAITGEIPAVRIDTDRRERRRAPGRPPPGPARPAQRARPPPAPLRLTPPSAARPRASRARFSVPTHPAGPDSHWTSPRPGTAHPSLPGATAPGRDVESALRRPGVRVPPTPDAPAEGEMWNLAIDFGTSNTTGATWADGVVEAVEVDGRRQVPSVVLLSADGTWVVGRQADNQSAVVPERVERAPKRRLGKGRTLLLGGQAVPITSAVAALLGPHTAAARARHAGDPGHIVLTHPARWGPERLDVLRAAAHEAGFPRVELVPEPVAAAHYVDDPLEVGQHVAVYDLGGGTFDTCVVRRTETSFKVVGLPGRQRAHRRRGLRPPDVPAPRRPRSPGRTPRPGRACRRATTAPGSGPRPTCSPTPATPRSSSPQPAGVGVRRPHRARHHRHPRRVRGPGGRRRRPHRRRDGPHDRQRRAHRGRDRQGVPGGRVEPAARWCSRGWAPASATG